ncbi:Mrr restriction system protein [Ruminococcus sp. AF12-5]|nr:Mrr restriction system protein [Ruminococcus sp. AF12-5]
MRGVNTNMFYDDLNTEEQVSYLIKPILQVLKEAGGQLERSEIRDRISELDEHIAEFEQKLYTSNKTGNQYKKFDFKFNFAIKELSYVGLISYVKFNPKITLTQDGANVDLTDFDVKAEVRDKARSYWEEHSTKNKSKNKLVATSEVEDEENESTEDELLDEFKVKLQSAIANMSPAKFEQFSRALLTKMGVEFTNKGVQVSNDGGIDGYGYHVDADDFRTTRVVIQCKRFNSNPVSEPDINQFLGAMNKYQADYGVFITNSRFTNKAREAAREGTPITLIDGNDLIRLVIKYELYITPVTTYVLDDFYTEN